MSKRLLKDVISRPGHLNTYMMSMKRLSRLVSLPGLLILKAADAIDNRYGVVAILCSFLVPSIIMWAFVLGERYFLSAAILSIFIGLFSLSYCIAYSNALTETELALEGFYPQGEYDWISVFNERDKYDVVMKYHFHLKIEFFASFAVIVVFSTIVFTVCCFSALGITNFSNQPIDLSNIWWHFFPEIYRVIDLDRGFNGSPVSVIFAKAWIYTQIFCHRALLLGRITHFFRTQKNIWKSIEVCSLEHACDDSQNAKMEHKRKLDALERLGRPAIFFLKRKLFSPKTKDCIRAILIDCLSRYKDTGQRLTIKVAKFINSDDSNLVIATAHYLDKRSTINLAVVKNTIPGLKNDHFLVRALCARALGNSKNPYPLALGTLEALLTLEKK